MKRVGTSDLDQPLPDGPLTETEYNYTHMMARDERRFKVANRDGDLSANRQEFMAFLHPENHDYMKHVVVQVGPASGQDAAFR